MSRGPLVGTWQLREAAKRRQRVETDVTWTGRGRRTVQAISVIGTSAFAGWVSREASGRVWQRGSMLVLTFALL